MKKTAMKKIGILGLLLMASSAISVPTQAQSETPDFSQGETLNFSMSTIDSNGICGVGYPINDEITLEFRVNSENLYIDIVLQNLPGDMVNAGLDKDNVPITLIINDSYTSTADQGVYQAGFTYRAVANWSDVTEGYAAFDATKDMEKFEVQIDGKSFGPASVAPVGFGYNYLLDCLERNGFEF